MSFLNRLSNRSTNEGADAIDSAEAGSADEQQLPIARYDHLDAKEVAGQLDQLSQVELTAVEAHERSHGDRPVVLNKLRWLQGSEPLPGYDALDTKQIVEALAGADAGTVRLVREYEFKFQRRQQVIDEAGRVLPTSSLSAGEDTARDEKAARISAGTAQAGKSVNGARPEA